MNLVEAGVATRTLTQDVVAVMDSAADLARTVEAMTAHVRTQASRANGAGALTQDETDLVCEIGETLGLLREACLRAEILGKALAVRPLPERFEPLEA